MSVRLEAIAFNHDPGSHSHDALNIRCNAARVVSVPEWRHGESTRPIDSVAAYAIEETRGQTLTVEVTLARLDASLHAVEVRAVAPPTSATHERWMARILQPLIGAPALYWAYYRLYLGWLLALPRPRPVLGEVLPRRLHFGADGSVTEEFELAGAGIWNSGVGVQDLTWHWQWRPGPGSSWSEFQVTRHRIYTVLREPTRPWRQTPFNSQNTQLPWRDVLHYACRWGRGASTAADAATRVTDAVFALGPRLVAYDCPGGGITHYTLPFTSYFDCTGFLERLQGGLGNGYYLNCTDCAAIVSTVANILGCDLWQSTMGFRGLPFFGVNPVRTIGSPAWMTPCGWGAFDYHEVAWKGQCTAADQVFDACLLVDVDPDPTRPPHLPHLPANMPFGEPGDGQYRDRLAAPAGRRDCEPIPTTRSRRLVL